MSKSIRLSGIQQGVAKESLGSSAPYSTADQLRPTSCHSRLKSTQEQQSDTTMRKASSHCSQRIAIELTVSDESMSREVKDAFTLAICET